MHKRKHKDLRNIVFLLALFLVFTHILVSFDFKISSTTYKLLDLADMIAVVFIFYIQLRD